MADLRKDPVTGRWVIISTERQKRPTDFQIETVTTRGDELCPFCQGHEDKTPPEILSYRNGGGWDVRVVHAAAISQPEVAGLDPERQVVGGQHV